MENISEVFGVAKITTLTESDCYMLYSLLSQASQNGWRYGIYYSGIIDPGKELPKDELTKSSSLSVNFKADGMRSFQANITNMFVWLKPFLTEKEWEFLTKTTFAIQYDYMDCNPAIQMLDEESIIVTHEAGKDPSDSFVTNVFSKDYPFTPYWVTLKMRNYDLDDTLEFYFNWDNIDKEDKEELFCRTVNDYAENRHMTNEDAKTKVFRDSRLFRKAFYDSNAVKFY